MRYFAQFYYQHENAFREQLGSDGIMPMDNRWSMATMKQKARERAQRLNRVTQIDGFRIFRVATRLNSPFFMQASVQRI